MSVTSVIAGAIPRAGGNTCFGFRHAHSLAHLSLETRFVFLGEYFMVNMEWLLIATCLWRIIAVLSSSFIKNETFVFLLYQPLRNYWLSNILRWQLRKCGRSAHAFCGKRNHRQSWSLETTYFVFYPTPLHRGLLFRSRTISASAFLSFRNAFFFASLFLGFYFLFTSAFNFGPIFTLASDRATRDRSILMLRTHHEAKIPTTNHI